ncbi:MAG: glycosidase [Flavisolibacter sp.]|nr:glycosidase [Flavisolibacter sp.]
MRFSFILFCILLTMTCHSQNKLSQKSKTGSANQDWALLPFAKADSVNPVLIPDSSVVFHCPIAGKPIKWEEKDVFNPATLVRNDTLFLLYRAEDKVGKYAGTSRIGLAYSTDGFHFTKHPAPVFYPDNDAQKKYEWEGGCEDPRVVEDGNGTYFMTYTSYDGKVARLMVASSKDLFHWTKHGPAFAKAYNGKYADFWSKSGSIVSRYVNGKVIATKVNGRYWMYWGDQNIWAATSDDLINWSPVLYGKDEKPSVELRGIAKEAPELKIVFGPRNGYFDSDLVEPGPPAMLTDKGIVLIYNSRNVPAIGDPALPEGTYAAAQILMDKNNPARVINRMQSYFMRPDKPYEISGQVNNVCFVEGLALYKGKWFLYYGTADSKIAVAVKQ